MTLLVRAGLASREAALSVVNELEPEFSTGAGMRGWLASNVVGELSMRENWPSRSTAILWRRFRDEVLSNRERAWRNSSASFDIFEVYDRALPDCGLVRLEQDDVNGGTWLTGSDFRKVGWLEEAIDVLPRAVTYAELDLRETRAHVRRIGPDI